MVAWSTQLHSKSAQSNALFATIEYGIHNTAQNFPVSLNLNRELCVDESCYVLLWMLNPQAKLIRLKKRLLVRFGALMICTLLALLLPVAKRGVDKLAFRGPIPAEQCPWNAKRSICDSTVDHPRILAEPGRLKALLTSCQRSRWQFCGWTAMMFNERILFAVGKFIDHLLTLLWTWVLKKRPDIVLRMTFEHTGAAC